MSVSSLRALARWSLEPRAGGALEPGSGKSMPRHALPWSPPGGAPREAPQEKILLGA